MQVNIVDEPGNWVKWGQLVKAWVFGTTALPGDTGALQQQMDAAGVDGSVPGLARGVTFIPFNDAAPLIIPLPTQTMITAGETELTAIGAQADCDRTYPLASFYAIAFGGADEVDLTPEQISDFGACRLGEYVILECQ